jgi:hypothetical protein
MAQPSGRILRTRQEVWIGGKLLEGTKPKILVYARYGSRHWRDAWHKTCKRYSLTLCNNGEPVQVFTDEDSEQILCVFEVTGAVDSLYELALAIEYGERPGCEQVELAISSRVPHPFQQHWCAGGGAKKKSAPKPIAEIVLEKQVLAAKRQLKIDEEIALQRKALTTEERQDAMGIAPK